MVSAGSAASGPTGHGAAATCGTPGRVLVLGSDWPVAHYDARLVLGYARQRTLPGSAIPPVTPEQALTGLQSLEGMTSQAALGRQRGDVAGRIAPGYRADLTAFSVDPVTAPADEVAAAPIRLTMVDGAVTHRAGQLPRRLARRSGKRDGRGLAEDHVGEVEVKLPVVGAHQLRGGLRVARLQRREQPLVQRLVRPRAAPR